MHTVRRTSGGPQGPLPNRPGYSNRALTARLTQAGKLRDSRQGGAFPDDQRNGLPLSNHIVAPAPDERNQLEMLGAMKGGFRLYFPVAVGRQNTASPGVK
jgi:hypothetical protein